MNDEFRIIRKDELNNWFSGIVDSYVKQMEWDLNKPEDLHKLNQALDAFSKGMVWSF